MQFYHLRVADELGVTLEPSDRGVDVRVGVGQHVEPAWSVGRSMRDELKQHVCRRGGN
jgi:hypothetical protein